MDPEIQGMQENSKIVKAILKVLEFGEILNEFFKNYNFATT